MKVWMILVTLLLCGCGGEKLQALGSEDVILAFGDSLTAGKGVSQEYSYPTFLSDITGKKVVNAGISGETTEEGLARIAGVMDETNPALLILFEGGNDILRNEDLAKTQANLDAMIVMAKERGIQVALVGLPRKQLFSSTAEFYNDLAESHELPIEDEIVASLLRQPKMKSDSVHFNRNGYRALAQAIADMLKEAGAL